MSTISISSISARQILDSRGNPTVEVDVLLSDGAKGRASVPSGASTGAHESHELRDRNPDHFQGKGVEKAVFIINETLAPALLNNDPFDQVGLDNEIVLRDGSATLSTNGANASLAISLAVSKAASDSLHMPYFRYIHHVYRTLQTHAVYRFREQKMFMPVPFFNIMNGGAHTSWQTTDFQEFMIVPRTARTFKEALEIGSEVYHVLRELLKNKGYSILVGDEGGFAPSIKGNQPAIELILEAIHKAGLKAGHEVALALDPAMSELYQDGKYHLKTEKKVLSTEEVIALWKSWVSQYPIISIEDGLAEDDWQGWQLLQQELGAHTLLVGDDFLVTNTKRIAQAIQQKACNALLMKVNQIGTLTESLQAITMSREANWKVIVSHRSGETEDTSIADIAVGTVAEYVKMGAPARTERTAKYNQLLRIEEQLT